MILNKYRIFMGITYYFTLKMLKFSKSLLLDETFSISSRLSYRDNKVVIIRVLAVDAVV